MAVIKAVSSKAGIGQALDYVTKEEKTEDKLVSGLILVSLTNAVILLIAVGGIFIESIYKL